jgi:hypothetical protein
MTSKPINVSTLVNKHELDLAKAILGASNIIFIKKMKYSNNIFDRIDHGYPFNFQVPQYFIAFCFHDFLPIGQIPNIFWGYG